MLAGMEETAWEEAEADASVCDGPENGGTTDAGDEMFDVCTSVVVLSHSCVTSGETWDAEPGSTVEMVSAVTVHMYTKIKCCYSIHCKLQCTRKLIRFLLFLGLCFEYHIL